MIKLIDILTEYSHNNSSTGTADAGEPDTGWTAPRQPECWAGNLRKRLKKVFKGSSTGLTTNGRRLWSSHWNISIGLKSAETMDGRGGVCYEDARYRKAWQL